MAKSPARQKRGPPPPRGRPAARPAAAPADGQDPRLGQAVAAFQAGRFEDAVKLFGVLAERDPPPAPALIGLGASLRRTGDLEGAAKALERAVAIAPSNPEAQNNLGNVRRAQGRRDDAIACFRKALALAPDMVAAMDNLAEAAGPNEAIEMRRARVEAKPDDPAAWTQLAQALQGAGRSAASEAAARQALALQPDYMPALRARGFALDSLGRLDEAVEAMERVAAADPADRLARLQRAQSLITLGRPAEALKIVEDLGPGPEAWERQVVEARASFLSGDYARAWPAYECRWKLPKMVRHTFDCPTWDGEDLAGKRIVVWAEQGAGDAVQFVRLAPRLSAMGAHVILMAPPEMTVWLKDAPGVAEVVNSTRVVADYEIALLSVCRVLNITTETAGAPTPYLPAPKDRAAPPPVARSKAAVKVGVAWSGNPAHVNDRRRSSTLEGFLGLAGVPGVQLFSLMAGPHAAGLQGAKVEPIITDLSPWLNDWRDTAAAVAALDLLIMVDTGPGHVAGALGVPVWLLLSKDCDWRWVLGRDDTPWYPNHRLIRQDRLGDWDNVLVRARAALVEFAAARNSAKT